MLSTYSVLVVTPSKNVPGLSDAIAITLSLANCTSASVWVIFPLFTYTSKLAFTSLYPLLLRIIVSLPVRDSRFIVVDADLNLPAETLVSNEALFLAIAAAALDMLSLFLIVRSANCCIASPMDMPSLPRVSAYISAS